MHETVQQRGCRGVVAQVGPPVGDHAVGGHHQAAAQLVALVDQRLQQLGPALGQALGQEQIVEHHEIGVDDRAQARFARRCGAKHLLGHELIGVAVDHAVALQDRVVGDGLADVAFAGAWRADQNGVVGLGDELQRMQLEAGRLGQLGVEPPVELGKRELLVQAGLLVAPLDQARAAPVELVLQDQREGLQERLIGALRLEDARVQRSAHSGQARSCLSARSISGKVMVIAVAPVWMDARARLARRFDRRRRCTPRPGGSAHVLG